MEKQEIKQEINQEHNYNHVKTGLGIMVVIILYSLFTVEMDIAEILPNFHSLEGYIFNKGIIMMRYSEAMANWIVIYVVKTSILVGVGIILYHWLGKHYSPTGIKSKVAVYLIGILGGTYLLFTRGLAIFNAIILATINFSPFKGLFGSEKIGLSLIQETLKDKNFKMLITYFGSSKLLVGVIGIIVVFVIGYSFSRMKRNHILIYLLIFTLPLLIPMQIIAVMLLNIDCNYFGTMNVFFDEGAQIYLLVELIKFISLGGVIMGVIAYWRNTQVKIKKFQPHIVPTLVVTIIGFIMYKFITYTYVDIELVNMRQFVSLGLIAIVVAGFTSIIGLILSYPLVVKSKARLVYFILLLLVIGVGWLENVNSFLIARPLVMNRPFIMYMVAYIADPKLILTFGLVGLIQSKYHKEQRKTGLEFMDYLKMMVVPFIGVFALQAADIWKNTLLPMMYIMDMEHQHFWNIIKEGIIHNYGVDKIILYYGLVTIVGWLVIASIILLLEKRKVREV